MRRVFRGIRTQMWLYMPIMDALLGAAALGDIGKHFPDTDPQYKGISSIRLLEHVAALLDEKQFVIENIDATIVAQQPKMRPYIDEMIKNVADALNLMPDQVNIKATTEEGLGFYRARRGDFLSGGVCSGKDYELQQLRCDPQSKWMRGLQGLSQEVRKEGI